MCFRSLILSTMVLAMPIAVQAHPGHLEIAEEEVIPTATHHVATLIEKGIEIPGIGKLDKSWSKVGSSSKKIDKTGEGYYIVSFVHPREKKILYLLIGFAGELYDANLTGKFEGIEN